VAARPREFLWKPRHDYIEHLRSEQKGLVLQGESIARQVLRVGKNSRRCQGESLRGDVA
jgi:hypothetical protein